MRVDISLDMTKFKNRLNQIERELPDQLDDALQKTAFFGSNLIATRTQAGFGIKGMMAAYTPEYAEFRRKKGRGIDVDLNFTGQMWASLTAVRNRGYAEIRFSDALGNRKAYFNNKRRPFFGFNAEETKRLVEFMKKRLFE